MLDFCMPLSGCFGEENKIACRHSQISRHSTLHRQKLSLMSIFVFQITDVKKLWNDEMAQKNLIELHNTLSHSISMRTRLKLNYAIDDRITSKAAFKAFRSPFLNVCPGCQSQQNTSRRALILGIFNKGHFLFPQENLLDRSINIWWHNFCSNVSDFMWLNFTWTPKLREWKKLLPLRKPKAAVNFHFWKVRKYGKRKVFWGALAECYIAPLTLRIERLLV